jgi:ubiquinone/menaquinone biosynthesis C-methylase UbiE
VSNTPDNTYVIDSESGAEMARLTDQDRLFTEATCALFPQDLDFTTVSRILDVACGSGGWVLEMAFKHPEVDVMGIDISQTMIQYANAQATVQGLENASFRVLDVLQPLDFSDGFFDVINARFLISFMYKEAWPKVIHELMRVLRPGGMICLTEVDDWGISSSSALERMKRLFYRAIYIDGRSFEPDGRHFGITPMLRQFLHAAGCQNIHEQA